MTQLHHIETNIIRCLCHVVIKFIEFAGTIVMYCKGAETAILEKTVNGPADETLSHINSYAEV